MIFVRNLALSHLNCHHTSAPHIAYSPINRDIDVGPIIALSFERLDPKVRKVLCEGMPMIQTNRGVEETNYIKVSFVIRNHQICFGG